MKKSVLSRSIVLLLVLVLLLTGCTAGKPGDTTAATEETSAPAPDQTTNGTDATISLEIDADITYFSVNLNLTGTDNRYLMAYPNDDGTVYVEYVGDVKKVGSNMDAAVLEQIAVLVAQSNILDLNGRNEYVDGGAIGSAYVEYSDGTVIGIAFTGVIPQEYQDAYGKLDAGFQTLTADLEVYVPAPVVMDGVDETAKAELLDILQKSQIRDLDMFQISDVAKDDVFALVMGLSSGEGVAVGTSCSAMMMTTPYSLVIATLEEGADAQAVRDDFLANLDWQKWVCVLPTDALIAQKDNMVLCLMGADELFDQTLQAITDCGWENMEQISNPMG